MTKGPGSVLVLGGARSGKSRFAERMAEESGLGAVYFATARPGEDEEMAARIDHHRARRGSDWTTLEEPLQLAELLVREAAADKAILVDCLTLWITNLMLEEWDVEARCEELAERVTSLPGLIILVSNEVGMGIVPENRMAREFRDHAGRLHQKLGEVVDEVYLVAAGLPMKLKG
ncbi:MAG: adenosylcobinamide kinase/adenosylcobinamide phosphate guanyltransferase [Rhizobiaceae bacterium MnEN-MB40S]|nr:MAG: adenosylcobinamide kinase/adenosylcobinamide phosphate guanyltransferase [Rhizobiaceae bacterium MnEN-MB40S]